MRVAGGCGGGHSRSGGAGGAARGDGEFEFEGGEGGAVEGEVEDGFLGEGVSGDKDVFGLERSCWVLKGRHFFRMSGIVEFN